MKYELGRLGPENFEHMIQSLVQGIAGLSTSVFGAGPDGQREAVIEGVECSINGTPPTHGRTVVQAKYKSPDTKTDDWSWLSENLTKELDGFRKKAKSHPALIPETYLFFTNIALTPVLDKGVHDKAQNLAAKYKDVISDIRLFGLDDIRAMLENNRDVARSYSGFLLPGDVLETMQHILEEIGNERFEDLIEYARQMFREDSPVRLEQAGSVLSRTINLRNVYTDLEAKSLGSSGEDISQIARYIISLGNRIQKRSRAESGVSREGFPKRSENAPEHNMVLIGSAGQGKSTLCQYICQIYRAALLRRFKHCEPEISEYLSGDDITEDGCLCCERFPIQISLRNFAAWLNKQSEDGNRSVLAYILSRINAKAQAQLSIPDLRSLFSAYPWVFLFDGLDEVPASSNRGEVLWQIQVFLDMDLIDSCCDSLVICTSRPQGYDAAFSTDRYRHFELQDMSKPLCERYIERLLIHLEDNSDERDRYRRILYKALDDPIVSKLMTTPLYTAIIVILVKMGGTPPSKRYELFHDYCETVIRRERQKGTLPTLNDSYDWITALHAQLGFLLQIESESSKNAAAELSATRCKTIIVQFLRYECHDGDIQEKAEELYKAITKRLSFLSEVNGADQEDSVVFPLRSIQEYFASEWLITFSDENILSEALEIISISSYWRNVFLFAAGFFIKHRERRNINEAYFRICLRNNGDENYRWDGSEVCQVTLQGSWLALDLLCDNLFSRASDQQRFLRVAAKLIETDYDGIDLRKKLMQLPLKTAEDFLKDHIIPHIREATRINDSLFLFLWDLSNRGSELAYRSLETICDTDLNFSFDTAYNATELGAKHIGDKALGKLIYWLTEDGAGDFSFMLFKRETYEACILEYLTRTVQEELPLPLLRLLVYQQLFLSIFEEDESSIPSELASRNALLQSLIEDQELQNFLRLFGGNRDSPFCQSIFQYANHPCLVRLEAAFDTAQLSELAALMAFLSSPSQAGLVRLIKSYTSIPAKYHSVFTFLLNNCNWLLTELAGYLNKGTTAEELINHYDSTNFEDCLHRDAYYRELEESEDYDTITRTGNWRHFSHPYAVLSARALHCVLEVAEESNIDESLIANLSYSLREAAVFTPELAEFCMRHFHRLLQSREGIGLALRTFAYVERSSLVSGQLFFPEDITVSSVYLYLVRDLTNEILDRVEMLVGLGGKYLQSYSFLVFLTPQLRFSSRIKIFADAATRNFADVKATGNRAALLGCVLCMLSGSMSDEQKELIRSCQTELFDDILISRFWYRIMRIASIEGQLFIHEILRQLQNSEATADLICRYTSSIREDQESRPVNQEQLTTLAKSAHSD